MTLKVVPHLIDMISPISTS